MNTNDTLPSQDEVQRQARRKRWIIVIVIICLLVLLCVLTFCVLGVMGIMDAIKPKTNAAIYQDASISHMVETSQPERYYSPEDWMLPVPGALLFTGRFIHCTIRIKLSANYQEENKSCPSNRHFPPRLRQSGS